jgi:hypothetical protein
MLTVRERCCSEHYWVQLVRPHDDLRFVDLSTPRSLGYECTAADLATMLQTIAGALGPARTQSALSRAAVPDSDLHEGAVREGEAQGSGTEVCQVCEEPGQDRRTLLVEFCIGDWEHTHRKLSTRRVRAVQTMPIGGGIDLENSYVLNMGEVRACKECRGDFLRLLRAWLDGKAFRRQRVETREPVEPYATSDPE